MEREEQIMLQSVCNAEERLKKIGELDFAISAKSDYSNGLTQGFKNGAMWAYKNQVSNWKNIKDQKPKIGQYCLFTIVDRNGSFNALGFFRKGRDFFYVDNWHGGINLFDDYEVYWLAIPELKI